MIVQTRTVVFARPKADPDQDRLYWAHRNGYPERGVPFTHEAPTYGQVEIVEKTTTQYLRANLTGMPGREDVVTEKVLVTLNAAAASHLTQCLVRALVTSLETGPESQFGIAEQKEA